MYDLVNSGNIKKVIIFFSIAQRNKAFGKRQQTKEVK
jgi:hypothetical protein